MAAILEEDEVNSIGEKGDTEAGTTSISQATGDTDLTSSSSPEQQYRYCTLASLHDSSMPHEIGFSSSYEAIVSLSLADTDGDNITGDASSAAAATATDSHAYLGLNLKNETVAYGTVHNYLSTTSRSDVEQDSSYETIPDVCNISLIIVIIPATAIEIIIIYAK